MFLRKFPFWNKVTTSKLANDISEIRQMATSGWKKEIANSPKVFFYAVVFGAGYHFYEASIRPNISNPIDDEGVGVGRRPAKPKGK